jgi:hypothetical protein
MHGPRQGLASTAACIEARMMPLSMHNDRPPTRRRSRVALVAAHRTTDLPTLPTSAAVGDDSALQGRSQHSPGGAARAMVRERKVHQWRCPKSMRPGGSPSGPVTIAQSTAPLVSTPTASAQVARREAQAVSHRASRRPAWRLPIASWSSRWAEASGPCIEAALRQHMPAHVCSLRHVRWIEGSCSSAPWSKGATQVGQGQPAEALHQGTAE